MERKTKLVSGEYYHLYSRGVEKRKVFLDSRDYERFIFLLYIMNQKEPFHFANFLKTHKSKEIFNIPKEKSLVSILCYTLMPNHFHILVYENEEGGISKFMMQLLTAYSMYFNTKYERSGPLFVHPFRSTHVSKESQYLWIFSYIHLNPVKIFRNNFKDIGIGNKTIAKKFLESYKYSSYADYNSENKTARPESKIIDFSLVPQYLLKTRLNINKYEEWFRESNYQGLPSIIKK